MEQDPALQLGTPLFCSVKLAGEADLGGPHLASGWKPLEGLVCVAGPTSEPRLSGRPRPLSLTSSQVTRVGPTGREAADCGGS